MRGPNKKKRDGHSVERSSPQPDDRRRGSIISIGSTGSATSDLDGYRFPEMPPSVQASVTVSRPESRASVPHIMSPHPPSPHRQISRSHDFSISIPSSPLRYPIGDGAGPLSPLPQVQISGPPFTRRPRPRPPPLHLGDAAFFNASAFLQRAPLTPDVPLMHSSSLEDSTPTYAARRQSLPSYLAHGFTPTPPVLAAERSQLSDHSHSRSNSTSEAPMTPLTVPEGGLDISGDLGYPDELDTTYESGRTLGDIQEGKELFESLPRLGGEGGAQLEGEPTSVGVTVLDVSPIEAHISFDMPVEMQA